MTGKSLPHESAPHPMALAVTFTILALALILLIAFIVRQERKARRIEKTLDYSKVREWHDDDDDQQ